MKLTYFHYHLARHDSPGQRFVTDITKMLFAFSAFSHTDFKNSFEYKDGEKVFLFWVAENTYLLISTKSNEIIKTINSDNVDFGDVYARLESNESLGFASYLHLGDRHYGLAATIHGPKNSVLNWLVNEILDRARIKKYEFVSTPFETTATRAEAVSLPIVGKHIIEVTKDNSLFQSISGLLGFGNTTEVDSLEVIIKPAKRNIRGTAIHVAQNLEEDGLKKYIIRAKASLEDALTDFYITGVGTLADAIDKRNEKTILSQIKSKAQENEQLENKLEELRNDPQYVTRTIPALSALDEPASWDRLFPAVGGN